MRHYTNPFMNYAHQNLSAPTGHSGHLSGHVPGYSGHLSGQDWIQLPDTTGHKPDTTGHDRAQTGQYHARACPVTDRTHRTRRTHLCMTPCKGQDGMDRGSSPPLHVTLAVLDGNDKELVLPLCVELKFAIMRVTCVYARAATVTSGLNQDFNFRF